jgi:ABC-type antimicrobial peptide transport system permease subunit
VRAPGLTSALLLTIALGIGSNAAVYGFLKGLTHPASPVGNSDGIVSIFRQDGSRDAGPLSSDDFRLLQSSSRGELEWIGAARIEPHDAVINGQSAIESIAIVSPELAGTLALRLDIGVVISHAVWKNQFDGRGNAIGSTIRIGKRNLKIEAVAPERLDGLYSDQRVDLWVQSGGPYVGSDDPDKRDLWVLARLRRGVSYRKAQAALASGSTSLREMTVIPFTGIAPNIARGLARISVFLNFAAAVVFFIACINVASFLLARALRRSGETSLRIALGATRAELLRDLFADSIVISVAGGALGLVLGIATAHALPAFLLEEDAARLNSSTHLLPILAASSVCILITVLCGMMPVLGTVTDRPWTVLQGETGSPSKAIRRLRSGLVVGQITACCMLVVCAALLLNGLHSALETSAGHRLGDPILLTVEAHTGPDGPEIDPNYFSRVEQKAAAVPGLSPLAWTARLPGNQPTWQTFRIQQRSAQYRVAVMDVAWLTPDSIQLLDSESIVGRMFGLYDQGRSVAVVNEQAAAEIFGNRSAGIVIRDSADRPIEIIGVIRNKTGDAKQQIRPTIYYGYIDRAVAPSRIRHAKFRIPLTPPVEGIQLSANVVSANYFRALGIRQMGGQTLPENRTVGQRRVAVINLEAARLYFNGKPLGAGVIDDSGVRTEIIGVVGSQVLGTFQQHTDPTIYFPLWQDCLPRMTLLLRHSQWDRGVAADLRQTAERVPGRASSPIVIKTLQTQLAQSGLAGLRIATLIGATSAATGLMLSILGLLSAQSDAERQRQRDRALRIALGARRWRIIFMIMKDACLLALWGTLMGISVSFALSRLLIANLTGIPSPPLQVWLIAPLLPAAAVMIASLLPARRASAISPLSIMRDS